MRLEVSSHRNTPAKLSLKGTTALLKILFEFAVRFLGMIGLPEYRQSGPRLLSLASLASQGMLPIARAFLSMLMLTYTGN